MILVATLMDIIDHIFGPDHFNKKKKTFSERNDRGNEHNQ